MSGFGRQSAVLPDALGVARAVCVRVFPMILAIAATGCRSSISAKDSRTGAHEEKPATPPAGEAPRGEPVDLRVTCTRDRASIVVRDRGPGIPREHLERIFERFYTDRPHQGFGQNSGLGLSISKQIVEAHGGRIAAENRTGDETNEGTGGGGEEVFHEFVLSSFVSCLLTLFSCRRQYCENCTTSDRTRSSTLLST